MENQNIHILAERRRLSFVLALLMHTLLLVFLVFGMQWHSKPASPLEVEIWGGIPAPLQRQGQANGVEEADSVKQDIEEARMPTEEAPQKMPRETPVPVTKPDIVEERKKPEEKKPKEEPKKEAEKKVEPKKQEPPQKQTPPAVTKPAAKTSNNLLDIQNILKGAADGSKQGKSATGSPHGAAGGQPGGSARSAGGGKGNQLEGYLTQLKQTIRDKTIYVEKGTDNPAAVLKIFVLPDGTIREVQIISATGDPAFAAARKQALLLMQRLPPLPAGTTSFSEQRVWTLQTRLRE